MRGLDLPSIALTLVAVPLVWLIFRRLRDFLKEHIGHALDAVFWYASRLIKGSVATRVSLRQYTKVLLGWKKSQFLQVPGETETPLPIDDVFVPLRLDGGVAGRGAQRAHTDILEAGQRVRIVGDPGSGKSSLVMRLFRDTCKRGRGGVQDAALSALPKLLPVLITLKDFAPPDEADDPATRAAWAVNKLRTMVSSVQGFGMEDLFDSYIDGGGLLVLLDGLDEVSSDAYPATAAAISALSDHLGDRSENNTIVLTMRSQFHHQVRADFDERFPEVLHIEPFSPAEIYAFLARWPFREEPAEQVARIYAELTDRPTLRDMCRNPLVLAMYVATDQRGGATDKVDIRTAFYDQVVEELLVKRRSRQQRAPARMALLEQREEILGELAFNNLTTATSPANSVLRCDALETLSRIRNGVDLATADREWDLLENETGIVDEERPDESYRFIHLSFCEFLAAKYAALRRKDGWPALLDRHQEFRRSDSPQLRSRLVETIPFAVALLPPVERPGALRQVAALGDQDVLGRSLLESQAYDHPLWPSYVEDEMAWLLAAGADAWTDDWLQRLQLFTVIVRDAEEWGRLTGWPIRVEVESMFNDLVGTDRERLIRVFSAYATHDPAGAFRLADATGLQLAEEQPDLVMENCSDPPFLAIVLQRALASPAEMRRWAPLLAEAGVRQAAAATFMRQRQAPTDWVASRADAQSHERDWNSYGPLAPAACRSAGDPDDTASAEPRPSSYGALLTTSLSESDPVLERFEGLRLLAGVPAPSRGSIVPLLLAPFPIAVVLAGVIAGTRTTDFSHRSFGYWVAVLLADLLIAASALIALGLVSYRRDRERLYAALVNVAEPGNSARDDLPSARLRQIVRYCHYRLLHARLQSSVNLMRQLRQTTSTSPVVVEEETSADLTAVP